MCKHGLENIHWIWSLWERGTTGVPTLSVTFYLLYRSKHNKLTSVHLGWWAQDSHYTTPFTVLKHLKDRQNSKRPQVTKCLCRTQRQRPDCRTVIREQEDLGEGGSHIS